jgi:hypothetical protein
VEVVLEDDIVELEYPVGNDIVGVVDMEVKVENVVDVVFSVVQVLVLLVVVAVELDEAVLWNLWCIISCEW